MDILSIGNSFSQDAQRYLHRISQSDGFALNTVNLYIGGCSLATHYRNMLSEEEAYELEVNGEGSGFFVSLKEALLNRNWEIVTLQQASHLSFNYDTYTPYIKKLSEYVRKLVPKAKIYIHQTWAYEQGSSRLCEGAGYNDHKDMFCDLEKAYATAQKEISADGIIPSGELFQDILKSGVEKIHRDTFHATLGLGRYALGLLWYRILSGNSVENVSFSDFDEDVPQDKIAVVKKCVMRL